MGRDVQIITETFFDRDAVLKTVAKGRVHALKGGGALVRKIARQTLKKPRRKKLSELTESEQKSFELRKKIAKRKGEKAPKRPFANAPPGKPPYNKTGAVKSKIFFGYDAAADDVVIGPVLYGKGTVELLEHGGTATLPGSDRRPVTMQFQGNPFMRPALAAAAPKIPALFRDCVR